MIEAFETGTGTGEIGDILPTIVTADDARAYIRETHAQWARVDQDVRGSVGSTDEAFRRSFATDYTAWLTFRDDALEKVSFFNAKATMDQTDRWNAKAGTWRTALGQAGAKVTGPGPIVPGQGVPGDPASSSLVTWLVAAAIVVAGVFAVGYVLRSIPRAPQLLPKREAS